MVVEVSPKFQAQFKQNCVVTPLQEEASGRKYYRLQDGEKNFVLCVDPSFNRNFIELSAFYHSHAIPVSEVIALDESRQQMLVSFCGEKDLSFVTDDQAYAAYLQQAIDIILAIQKLQPVPVIAGRSFDVSKLMFELDFTARHLQRYAVESGVDDLVLPQDIYTWMLDLAKDLGNNYEFVICHRDYHSRNLMLKESGSLCLIDFQDSMMGVREYDLASLLYDAYRPVTADMRQTAIEYYLQKSCRNRSEFDMEFPKIALQRSFKALGSYLMLVGEKKMDKFKPSIFRCLENLQKISLDFDLSLQEYFQKLHRDLQKVIV